MRQRDTSLDIIRIFACLMVVLMHSPIPSANASGLFLVALSYITAPCIGLFFMVSGALLLPVKNDYFTFLRHRFGKVAIPTVVWSLIYIYIRWDFSESEIKIWQTIASLPFSAQGEGVLWFMYTLCGLYLLAPILSGWLVRASKREIEFVLILWAITLCYPLLEIWFLINDSNTGPLYYFGGYVGYFLLGYYLKNFYKNISLTICCVVALVGVALLWATKRIGIELDFYSVFWYLSIFIVALCIVLWKLVYHVVKDRKFGETTIKTLSLVSNLSFGVYLVHILVMRYWLWRQPLINSIKDYAFQTILITVITLIISFLGSLIVAKSPIGDFVIGFKERKKVREK